jgi:hypothetical protein
MRHFQLKVLFEKFTDNNDYSYNEFCFHLYLSILLFLPEINKRIIYWCEKELPCRQLTVKTFFLVKMSTAEKKLTLNSIDTISGQTLIESWLLQTHFLTQNSLPHNSIDTDSLQPTWNHYSWTIFSKLHYSMPNKTLKFRYGHAS